MKLILLNFSSSHCKKIDTLGQVHVQWYTNCQYTRHLKAILLFPRFVHEELLNFIGTTKHWIRYLRIKTSVCITFYKFILGNGALKKIKFLISQINIFILNIITPLNFPPMNDRNCHCNLKLKRYEWEN